MRSLSILQYIVYLLFKSFFCFSFNNPNSSHQLRSLAAPLQLHNQSQPISIQLTLTLTLTLKHTLYNSSTNQIWCDLSLYFNISSTSRKWDTCCCIYVFLFSNFGNMMSEGVGDLSNLETLNLLGCVKLELLPASKSRHSESFYFLIFVLRRLWRSPQPAEPQHGGLQELGLSPREWLMSFGIILFLIFWCPKALEISAAWRSST